MLLNELDGLVYNETCGFGSKVMVLRFIAQLGTVRMHSFADIKTGGRGVWCIFAMSEMPFAEMGCLIAIALQEGGDCGGFQIEPVRHRSCRILFVGGEMSVNKMSRRTMGRHEGAPTRRADCGSDIELFDPCALRCKPIEVGSFNVGMSCGVSITPTLIVSENEDDIWLPFSPVGEKGEPCEHK